ncbi:DUF3710 domain-containing protein [Gordonia desulfuricans]|uniref:DUF3710 domain-containing protein n=1 Tax=Gordonia desulfuricans TaxID=89051 RepID=A0A7K3LMX7_9ACTN|nr:MULTISPECIES: DUF3710 domain-containing protein [Gordonia]KOY49890.1 hypothetical protein ISGA_07140 [Gordonia sp. NB41Y]NDK89411.1 DUF3710 domain-containing protein [Gordonia desulfuricans]WLP91072.1 DUF3710 domain-containing protein [Gordonia sp. NB41Y]
MAQDGELRVGQALGPYDIEALDTPAEELANSHLDLGSVLVPVVEGGQVTVEMSPDHQPEGVYLVTPVGRISVTAFAAPKSPGLWREVVRELASSLRDDGATTSVEDGHWGREVLAEVPGAAHRFIGVDGPRWMVRCVASGPAEAAEQLAQLARAVLAESVVRRGKDPVPPREMLPIVLPPVLADQVAAAQQQMFGETGAEAGEPAAAEPVPASEPVADTAQAQPADAGDRVPGGALDQIEQATVVTEAPVGDAGGAEATADDASDASDAETAAGVAPDSGDADEAPPSSGSAMQRFRRRRSKN